MSSFLTGALIGSAVTASLVMAFVLGSFPAAALTEQPLIQLAQQNTLQPSNPKKPPGSGAPAAGFTGPSFPCLGSLSVTERAICNNAELSRYDREMVDIYNWVRGQLGVSEQALLRDDQRQWLRTRNRCGASPDCLTGAYLDRNAYLNEYFTGDGDQSGSGQVAFPLPAKSWGGQVRSGPGTQFRRVAGLSEGEFIEILEQADAPFFQDRPWFKIRFRDRTGYHWGGIICPLNVEVPGTFQVCN